MEGILNKNKIDYVLYHLEKHCNIGDELRSKMHFIPIVQHANDENIPDSSIIFYLNHNSFNAKNITQIDNLPVFFTDDTRSEWFIVKGKSVFFNNDILKTIFYFLSGYSELETSDPNKLKISKFNSVSKLGLSKMPFVNFLINKIIDGLEVFCSLNNLTFKRKSIFPNPVFMLSHDVDRLDKFHFYEVALRYMQFLGLKPTKKKKVDILKEVVSFSFNFLFFKKKRNTFWSFDFLRETEKEFGIKSTWFFLNKEGKHDNSRYYFSENRVKDLVKFLEKDGCEIGIHGTLQSVYNENSLLNPLKELNNIITNPISGIRQHCLNYLFPKTTRIHESAGLLYDNTLGFSDIVGFRNSYSYPFKLYDFDNDRMFDVWQIPLVMMDLSLIDYRELTEQEIYLEVKSIANIIREYGGVLSLLWHNCRLEDYEYPNARKVYKNILALIVKEGLVPKTGAEIIKDIEGI